MAVRRAHAGRRSRRLQLTPHKSGLADWFDSRHRRCAGKPAPCRNAGTLGGEMGEVVKNSTGRMRAGDREAIAIYLKSLPPLAKLK